MAKKITEIKSLRNFELLIDTYFKLSEENYNSKKEYEVRDQKLNSYLEISNSESTIQNLIVFPMISSYACELMLKYILLFFNGEFEKKHNLYDLFTTLEIDLQEELIELTNENYPFIEKLNSEKFHCLLKLHSNNFVEFRYLFSHVNLCLDEMFLMAFSKALKDKIEEIKKTK